MSNQFQIIVRDCKFHEHPTYATFADFSNPDHIIKINLSFFAPSMYGVKLHTHKGFGFLFLRMAL